MFDRLLSASQSRHIIALCLLVLAVALPGLVSIPAIDRDEARYAQATVQMIESGDYVDIRFQNDPRWKKPAGAYWAQAASVQALGGPEDRAIWKHRVPSVIGALIAVIATYFAGLALFDRRAGIIGASLFAVTLALTYEAHAAKTDALLVATTSLMFLALARLRSGAGGKCASVLLWAALGAGALIKGPIAPVIGVFTLIALVAWERKAAWMKPLLFWLGPLLALAIFLPWTYLIWQLTDGEFFRVAIGEDLAPKLQGGQEKHGAPPGYHLIALLIMFFPAILFLPSAISETLKTLRAKADESDVKYTLRFLVCWIVPFFILLELTPTKLPHYALPTYPALALLCGWAITRMIDGTKAKWSLWIGAGIFAFIGIVLAIIGVGGLETYRAEGSGIIGKLAGVILLALIVMAFWRAVRGHSKAWGYAVGTGAAMMVFAFGYVLPNLDNLLVSRQITQTFKQAGISTPIDPSIPVYSPLFTEPSLVFGAGTHITLGGDAETELRKAQPESLVILDREKTAEYSTLCLEEIGKVRGENYAKGDPVDLLIARVKACN